MDPQDPMNPYLGYDRELLFSFLAALDPDALVKEYEYSNLGAGLLGIVAADAAGLDYSKAMQREVIEPLGLADTGFQVRDDQTGRLAIGFSAGADMPNWNGFDALAGAGALLSTVDDMLEFVRQNFKPQALDASLAAIRESQATGETAFGWHIQDSGEAGPVFWHNGGTGGYASFLAFRPDNGTGVVILSASTEYNTITALGFAQVYGTTAEKKDVNLDPYPGVYQIAGGFVLTVYVDGDRLFAQATGQGAFPLTPSADNEFVFLAAGIKIEFELDDSGSAIKLVLHQGEQESPAPRTGDVATRIEIEVEESQLQDYVGEYQLAPKTVLTVVARDGQLFAQLTGQAAYPVFAYEADKFFYKVVDAQLHFERDGNGFAAVVLHQGGEQRAPRIE